MGVKVRREERERRYKGEDLKAFGGPRLSVQVGSLALVLLLLEVKPVERTSVLTGMDWEALGGQGIQRSAVWGGQGGGGGLNEETRPFELTSKVKLSFFVHLALQNGRA